jgi:hypothetical protein
MTYRSDLSPTSPTAPLETSAAPPTQPMETAGGGTDPSFGTPTWLSSVLTTVRAFVKTTLGSILAAVVGVLVTAAVSWVTPLGDVVRDWLWQEKVAIGEEVSATEKEVRELRFTLQTKTRGGFSGGTIEVSSPDQSIDFIGNKRFVVQASEGSITVPGENVLKIKPLTSGKHIVRVKLETNRGKRFVGDITVGVAGVVEKPYFGTQNSWTGTWRIIINGENGEMALIEREDSHLSGTTNLEKGGVFKIDSNSWQDGTAFLITLIGAEQRIRLEGFPCDVSSSGKKWRILNGKTAIFEGETSIPAPVALSTLKQRCDKW